MYGYALVLLVSSVFQRRNRTKCRSRYALTFLLSYVTPIDHSHLPLISVWRMQTMITGLKCLRTGQTSQCHKIEVLVQLAFCLLCEIIFEK